MPYKHKQIYKYNLCNEFLDKLALSETHVYLTHLRIESRLTLEQLAYILGLSPGSIKRYESTWKQSKPPKWYELLLRFLAGDLSFYGDQWADTRIHPFNKRLKTHFCKYNDFLPKDMNMTYNTIANQAKNELRELQTKLDIVTNQLNLLKKQNAELELINENLILKIDKMKAHENGLNTRKVINLFGS